MQRIQLAVVGAGSADESLAALAERVGEEVARAGAVLVCGGLGGVMEAACRGARRQGGLTVGILPGSRLEDANPHVDIVVATGLGNARNVVVVGSAHAVIALPGGHGTLSEVALGLKMGKRVVLCGEHAWELKGVNKAADAAEAVRLALGA